MNVIERVKSSGKCPPSLIKDELKEDSFEVAVGKIVDSSDLCLATGGSFDQDFKDVMQMTDSAADVSADGGTRVAILAQRRCIILAVVGSTPPNNGSLSIALQNGFLTSVKSWLDDILNGSIGGMDLLLHLLTNIINLPVNKSNVKDSGMGKAIGSIEKHKICAGTPNQGPIKERVSMIKIAWQKSVKALKDSSKRELEPSQQTESNPTTKKARIDEKNSSLSSLLNKVKPTSSTIPANSIPKVNTSAPSKLDKKKALNRVKWQDHFGGDLTASRTIEGDENGNANSEENGSEGNVSWSDRKKRDRLREKELLSKVKKAKLMDDDDDDGTLMSRDVTLSKAAQKIQPTAEWKIPSALPARSDAPPPQVDSTELLTQNTRMATVTRSQYASEYNVPSSPAPLSDVEQALDMTNQSSTVTQSIPFFVPQQVPTPAPAPAQVYTAPSAAPVNTWMAPPPPPQPIGLPPAPSISNAATPDFVQSLGLPMFLVGQDTQALQTLSNTPSLLSTFVDNNGMYDQARLTSLVQTLSQSSNAAGHASTATGFQPTYGNQPPAPYGGAPTSSGTGTYGPASGSTYGPASTSSYGGGGWQSGGRPSFKKKSDEGNLHLSGYGPTTTQTDIINLFSPYVQVDEVVIKGNFSFVNTSDPAGAARAKESLTGVLLGGSPIRINPATRRNKGGVPPPMAGAPSNPASIYGHSAHSVPGVPSEQPPMMSHQVGGFPGAPPPAAGTVDIDNVRDDRGNPATKNLFVAGYGQGTTEFQLRDLFGQYCNILAIIVKGTFSFVNTSDKADAIRSREMLSGTMFNGGVLRINFAKESGRLGTSFDVTYNRAGGGSHYGR